MNAVFVCASNLLQVSHMNLLPCLGLASVADPAVNIYEGNKWDKVSFEAWCGGRDVFEYSTTAC